MRKEYAYPASYLLMVLRFLRWRRETYGNTSKCFTYHGIISWAKRSDDYRDLEETTIERVIRKLAEDGFIKRVRERPRALFCINEEKVGEYLRRLGISEL